MPNPLVTGQVAPNRQSRWPKREEARLGLPRGALTCEVALTEMTAQKVCFALKLRTAADRAHAAEPKGWRMELHSEPEAAFLPPAIHDVQPVKQHKLPSSHTGGQIWTALADVAILTGGGTVCFASPAALTPDVRALQLDLTDAQPPNERSMTFEFRFD